MTNRLETNWSLDGFVDEQRYYCSETPIDTANTPIPKVIFAGDVRTYVDTDVEIGKTYYMRVGSVKNGVEKLSDEKVILFGKEWTPENLTSRSKIWLDTDSGITTTSGVVQTWANKGLLGGSFNQPNSTARPALSENTLNGHSVINFDGSNDLLLASSEMLNVYRNTSAFWVFAVAAKRTIAAKDFQIFEISNPAGTGTMFSLCATETIAQTKWTGYGKRLVSDTGIVVIDSHEANDTNFHMGFMSADFTNHTLFIGADGYAGSSVPTITPGFTSDTAAARIVLGCNASMDYWSNVSITAIIAGNGSIPSVDERKRLEGWAAHKYGLTGNLPPDHPYKTLIPTL